MKLSVSLPAEDVAVLDEYVRVTGLRSRSAAVRHAVRMLRLPHLEDDYAEAWSEWARSGDQLDWDTASRDGF